MFNTELLPIIQKIENLKNDLDEDDCLEFKLNMNNPQQIGEYISALSNSALKNDKQYSYIVWGINNDTHSILGTTFSPQKQKVKGQNLINFLYTGLSPRVQFDFIEDFYNEKKIVILKIEAAANSLVGFLGERYIRIGENKINLKQDPTLERKLWVKINNKNRDWSALVCEEATINDLNKEAILKAREQYKIKNPNIINEVDVWDDMTFLNKAKLTIAGKITNTALILLGKDEASHFLSPAIAQITWILKDEKDIKKDYKHFGMPFLLVTNKVYSQIRNLTYRYLNSNNSTFPEEINKYDPWVIREILNNCIVHQDYEMNSRITVIEKDDELVFSNAGNFLPGSIDNVISSDIPSKYYKNKFLADAMVNLNMIDTIGSGIRRVFTIQKDRFFPMPDYDINNEEVRVRIFGKVIDEKYARLLIEKTDLSLLTVMLLDNIQKGKKINRNAAKLLKDQGLIEGKYPNIFLSGVATSVSKDGYAQYIRNKSFDNKYFMDLLVAYIKRGKNVDRNDIDKLLVPKLPDFLDKNKKKTRIRNIIQRMRKNNIIRNIGTDASPKWIITDDYKITEDYKKIK